MKKKFKVFSTVKTRIVPVTEMTTTELFKITRLCDSIKMGCKFSDGGFSMS